jgi:predicted DNA-binding protein YlxM (UPF0122 family)
LERDIVKLREWVTGKHSQDWELDEIASHAQVPRSTCHRWITWAEEGWFHTYEEELSRYRSLEDDRRQ